VRRLLLAGLAAGLALFATPAQAHPSHHFEGDCGFDSIEDDGPGPTTDPDHYSGVVYGYAVATDPLGVPSGQALTLECVLYVNGVEDVVLTASGSGVATGASTLGFSAYPGDWVTMCTRVTVGNEAHEECWGDGMPPLFDLLIHLLNDAVFPLVDGTICPAFASLAPGVPGIVEFTAGGDVYVAGEFFWDCPPYDF
jgi:hypothetical protein